MRVLWTGGVPAARFGVLPWKLRALGRRVATVAPGMWLATAFGFGGTVVAARGLGVEGYGAVVLAISIVGATAALLDVSLEGAVVHYGFQAVADGDPGRLRALLRGALAVDVLVGAATFVLLLLMAGPFASYASLGRLDPGLIRLAALGTLAETANGTTGAALLIARRTDLRAWCMTAASLCRLLLVVVAVRVGGGAAVLVAFALASGLGAATQAVLAWRAGWKTWIRPVDPIRPGPSVASLLRFGFYSSMTTTVNAVRTAILPVLLGRLSGPGSVGILNVAQLPVSVGGIAFAPVRLAMYPEQARLAALGERKELLATFKSNAVLGFAVGVPAAIVGWFLLPWLLPALYSESFAAAVGPARVLLIVAVVQFMVGTAKTLPAAIGRPELQTLAALLDLVILALLVALLRHHDVMGAAVALAVVVVLDAAFLWWAIPRALRRGSVQT